ncbi:hypothetical protein AVEN_265490-1 [Araneus ventricosus]|uniref:Uncharacterized protein n=1 Tax=Araneus ventricosus TaxID=182803 RepID=A0A4Y2QCH4_ARAVE|nr:hypothetical protein AVEN_265490-1 [Araneus ventricosus]
MFVDLVNVIFYVIQTLSCWRGRHLNLQPLSKLPLHTSGKTFDAPQFELHQTLTQVCYSMEIGSLTWNPSVRDFATRQPGYSEQKDIEKVSQILESSILAKVTKFVAKMVTKFVGKVTKFVAKSPKWSPSSSPTLGVPQRPMPVTPYLPL